LFLQKLDFIPDLPSIILSAKQKHFPRSPEVIWGRMDPFLFESGEVGATDVDPHDHKTGKEWKWPESCMRRASHLEGWYPGGQVMEVRGSSPKRLGPVYRVS